MYTRKKYLIVDGYNVLRSGSRYKHITGPDWTLEAFNKARDTLINDVISFYNANYSDAIIVFDGGENRQSTGKQRIVGGVKIVFSPAGSSADKVIEKLAHDAREKGIETIVVTSDASIQDAVFGGGVDRMSANGFCLEMEHHFEQVRMADLPHVPEKNTIAQRIDSSTLEKLKTLRDSWSKK